MKVAIIGRGFGSYAMAPAFKAQGFTVEMVPSRDADAVRAACQGDADLISIHSPPFQHQEHVMLAVEAGKPVLCDKPFGRNAAEARAMRDAANAAGVPHFLNFEFRCNAGRRKAAELIGGGAIGDLVHMQYLSFGNYLRERQYGWLNDASLGGGWLGALCSHIIDAARWHGGSEVSACGGMTRIEIPVRPDGQGEQGTCTAEDAFSVWLRLANGVTMNIDAASATAVALPQKMTFFGSAGAIELVEENVVTLHTPGAVPQVFDCTPAPLDGGVWPAVHTWLGEVRQALEGGARIAPNFDDGVAAREVLDALVANCAKA